MIALLLAASASSGCSISRALSQPDKRDLSVLMPGRARAEVIAEVGQPTYQENLNGAQRDVFAFRQGYTRPVKTARAIGHGFGLFATLGLWELAGYPIELALNGEEVKVMVDYDPQFVVSEVTYLRGAHLRANGPTLPAELYGSNTTNEREIVRLSRGANGEVLVAYGSPPPSAAVEETRVAGAPPQTPEVNEATYYSSSEREGTIRASAASGTKLR